MNHAFSKILMKNDFRNRGQSLIGIIIVLVVVGLISGSLYLYFSKQIPEVPEIPEKLTKEEATPPEEELPKKEIIPGETVGQVSCVRETTKSGVTCGGNFYEDYCENLADGTEYADLRQCSASAGSNCSSLLGAKKIFCSYGCQNGVCLQTSPTPTPTPTPIPTPTSGNKKITSCNSIMGAGSYTMDKDLNATGNGCLDIQNVNDVHIDCGGHSIILDQQSKPLTEGRKPLLGLKNVKNFSVVSCNFKVINPSPAPSIVTIEDSSDGTISNNTFYDPNITSSGVDDFSIIIDRSTRIKFSSNTVYGVYQQHYSNNNIVENNTFAPTLKTLKQLVDVIDSFNGSYNTIRNNTIDGKWDGSDPNLKIGADDGIVLGDESYDTVQNNKIKNNWDCGIETIGLIQNSTISGNTILNSGICGIGAWYYNSWKTNLVADNTIDSAPKMFYFYRAYALRSGENAVYFTDNTFRGNSFLNPTQGVSAVFSFHASSGGVKGGTDNTPYVASNNQFVNNNFNSKLRAPGFFPLSMAVDGGGNICGAAATGDYPNTADFPLRCTSQ